jgi:hypothetical protein
MHSSRVEVNTPPPSFIPFGERRENTPEEIVKDIQVVLPHGNTPEDIRERLRNLIAGTEDELEIVTSAIRAGMHSVDAKEQQHTLTNAWLHAETLRVKMKERLEVIDRMAHWRTQH